MRKRRVEITVETAEFIVARRPGRRVPALCTKCDSSVGMLGLEEAMLVAGVGSREIHRRVEAGRLHFHETPDGHLWVCLWSLQGKSVRSIEDRFDLPAGYGE